MQKMAATGLALGSLAGGTMADEPTQMDPGANQIQAVQSIETSLDPSFGKISTDPKNYQTSGHYKVASNIVTMSYNNVNSEKKKLAELRQKKFQWQKDSGKIEIGIGPSSNPFTKQVIKQKEVARQAQFDLSAVRYVMSNPRFIERYADNPDKAKGKIKPGVGRKAGVAALKLYLQNVQQYEAPGSAGRNVPQ